MSLRAHKGRCSRCGFDHDVYRESFKSDAPAQSALDELRREVERLSLYENLAAEYGLSVFAESAQVIEELRREVEALRADRDRLACELGLAHRAITNALTLKRLDDPTIDTARASTDEGWGPVLHPKGNSDDN